MALNGEKEEDYGLLEESGDLGLFDQQETSGLLENQDDSTHTSSSLDHAANEDAIAGYLGDAGVHSGAGSTNDDEGVDVASGGGGDDVGDAAEDPELEAIKARVREMEEEAEKLKEMQTEVEKQMNLSSSSATSQLNLSLEEKVEADARSIYIGSVDYGATAEELEAHFHGCGPINRVTILCDKFTGHPKGFAYIEFTDKDSIATATALDESLFRGRQIKVVAKRTNRPGLSSTNRPPRGRGRRARSSYSRGGYRPYRRPRRSSWYSPY